MNGWIGVDFDGTLATYETGKYASGNLGEPIPAMVNRVKRWLDQGFEVRIFTARVSHVGHDANEVMHNRACIEAWCARHIGQALQVTCQKDYAMMELWDDRAVQVEMNTGKRIGYSTRETD